MISSWASHAVRACQLRLADMCLALGNRLHPGETGYTSAPSFRRNRRGGCFGTVATRYYRSTPLEKAQAWLRLFAQRATNCPKILPYPIAPLLDGQAERADFVIADIPAVDIAYAIRDIPSCEGDGAVSNPGRAA